MHQSSHIMWSQYIRVVKSLSFGVTQTEFQSLFYFLQAVFLGKFLTSSSHGFLVCKVSLIRQLLYTSAEKIR